MPRILMTILYILLFIVMLSFLIMIHELGHFGAAKIFKVYVQEYSIGFGPALIHKKRKNGETYFSLRIIPFGGYVSMYGEGTELEDGVVVDKSRSLDGIKRWKRGIILAAGVTMNALLALTMFFITNIAFTDHQLYLRNMTIAPDSIAEKAGLKTLDVLAIDEEVEENSKTWKPTDTSSMHLIDPKAVVTYSDDKTQEVHAYIDVKNLKNYKDIYLNKYIVMYASKDGGEEDLHVDFSKQIPVDTNFKSVTMNIKTVIEFNEKRTKGIKFEDHQLTFGKDSNGGLEDFGYSFYLETIKPKPFFKAIGQSFVDFGESATLIVRTFGTLFTKETWNSMGGIVAIGFESTSVLQNLGWGKFIYLWGAISVNLAIVNLFPFPGLDGWQLLVLIVEGTTRKKIPDKVKTIVSIVGLTLLFAFMAVILFKDLFTYVF